MSPSPSPSTSQGSGRQLFPDQIRGIALLGIVLVNAPFMAISLIGFDAASLEGGINRVVAFLVTMLAQTKVYLLFSFLFGYSSMFIIGDDTKTSRRVYLRRLVALFLLGVAHFVFLFIGDILVTYAVLGLGLLLLFKRSNKTVLISAVAVWALSTLLAVLTAVTVWFVPTDPELTAEVDAINGQYAEAISNGTFLEAALARIEILPLLLAYSLLISGYVFAAFCFGLLAARHQMLNRLQELAPRFRQAAIWGLALGLPIQFALTWFIFGPGQVAGVADTTTQAIQILLAVFAPILTVGYVGALVMIALHKPRALSFFSKPGRASLTIYLGESVLLCLIFCGWGFGLFGQLGAAAVTAVAIGTWALLAVAINWWLRRHNQGPLEYVVSKVTKGLARRT